jgi:hypothetical protein
MTGADASRRCDLCGESFAVPGGYGSGVLADGIYCSLTCFALSAARYAAPFGDNSATQGEADNHEPPTR